MLLDFLLRIEYFYELNLGRVIYKDSLTIDLWILTIVVYCITNDYLILNI